jgi:hypothetical protein
VFYSEKREKRRYDAALDFEKPDAAPITTKQYFSDNVLWAVDVRV